MAPAVAPPVRPVRGQLLHLRFASPPLSRIVWGSTSYLVPWADGSVLVGATVEDAGFDESVTVAGVCQLLESAVDLLPAARSATFEGARAGLRPATADELPIIGRSSTMRGMYYATGHYRNGVLLAPLTAAMIADLVLDTASLRVTRGNQEIFLSPIGLRLLTILMRESPRVVTRRDIEREIWGDGLPDSDTLRSHLYNLRKCVDRPFDKQLLHTVQTAGYRIADLETATA